LKQTIDNSIQFNIQTSDQLTRNVTPLLHEVKHALENLINNNQTAMIDLRSIPLAPGEEDTILSSLGCGEVQAELNALGLSEIYETTYAGVWIVSHFNDDNELIGRFIEITTMPEILRSQDEDIINAYHRLNEGLDDNQQTKESMVEKVS